MGNTDNFSVRLKLVSIKYFYKNSQFFLKFKTILKQSLLKINKQKIPKAIVEYPEFFDIGHRERSLKTDRAQLPASQKEFCDNLI